MQFPYKPTTHIQHYMGGTIELVHGIEHQACKPSDGRSLDGWWFDCDVKWADTGKVSRSPCEPFKMCAEEGGRNADIQALNAAMAEYLAEHGEWCDSKSKHEGWFAHRAADGDRPRCPGAIREWW
jgi:hypothetical protein